MISKKNLCFLLCSVSFAKLNVVTTTTDLAYAAVRIGGEFVQVSSMLNGTEDPHFVDAVPKYIQQVSNADVVCSIGLDLEVGWLPKVLSKSGNSKVQQGGSGYCVVGSGIDALDKISGPVDRSMGDVHPLGNPHFWLGPTYFEAGAKIMLEALQRADPKNAEVYAKNFGALVKDLKKLLEEGRTDLRGALGSRRSAFVEYHREFAYFFKDYGLKSVGTIEEKPGLAPSAGRLAQFGLFARESHALLALAGPYAPQQTLARFEEISGVPTLVLPTSTPTLDGSWDYLEWQRALIRTIVSKMGSKA